MCGFIAAEAVDAVHFYYRGLSHGVHRETRREIIISCGVIKVTTVLLPFCWLCSSSTELLLFEKGCSGLVRFCAHLREPILPRGKVS